jgi:hypothetical protein
LCPDPQEELSIWIRSTEVDIYVKQCPDPRKKIENPNTLYDTIFLMSFVSGSSKYLSIRIRRNTVTNISEEKVSGP